MIFKAAAAALWLVAGVVGLPGLLLVHIGGELSDLADTIWDRGNQ